MPFDPDLLELMPLTARRVLDLGGDDALAEAYQARNPKVDYQSAMPYLTGLGTGEQFDLIVLGDELQRAAEPQPFLARLHEKLSPDGHLLLSVSNAAHWRLIAQLIGARWPGEEAGLPRYTRETITTALSDAGFRLVKGKFRHGAVDQAQAEAWLPPLADLAVQMGIDRAEFLRRAQTLSYAFLAEKAGRPPRPLLHLRSAAFALRLMDARTRLPADYLKTVPDLMVSYVEKDHSLPPLGRDTPKVVIVQRHVPPSLEAWTAHLAKLIRGGWVVISEWDDHPDLIAAATKRSDFDNLWMTIGAAHGVQSSTEALAEAFRMRNPEVAVFPNTAFTLPPWRDRTGPPRIFYGAANRQHFSVPVAQALAPLLPRHPEAEIEVVHDRDFFDALPAAARKRFQPTLGYEDYLQTMAGCDIALLPLEGSGGERFKSDIKFIEAAARGVAVIASPAVYGDTVRDGETGLIAPLIADWARALDRLLADPALRNRIARGAWEAVRDTRLFADQVAERRDWYWSLWERRDALTAGLIERLPGLREALG